MGARPCRASPWGIAPRQGLQSCRRPELHGWWEKGSTLRVATQCPFSLSLPVALGELGLPGSLCTASLGRKPVGLTRACVWSLNQHPDRPSHTAARKKLKSRRANLGLIIVCQYYHAAEGRRSSYPAASRGQLLGRLGEHHVGLEPTWQRMNQAMGARGFNGTLPSSLRSVHARTPG